MRCIVHIWKSSESDGYTFRLRLTSHDSEGRGGVEGFSNDRLLLKRMAELGLADCICKMSLSNLRYESKSIWPNCEVDDDVFAEFGIAYGLAI